MKISMRFEGGAELARALDKLSVRASKRVLREVLKEASEPMRSAAQRNAPYEPGPPDIRENITVSNARTEDMAAVAIGPSKPFFYGGFQEWGTSRHAAQPFMRPAFDTALQRVLAMVRAGLWRELAARGIGQSARLSLPSTDLGAMPRGIAGTVDQP